jgi:hypothetical protein
MYKLSPNIGPAKWRYGVESRFQFNAQRCRKIAQGLTDAEERAYTLNLAELWEQLADAARFRQGFSSEVTHERGSATTRVAKTG